jgi:hypothetical protein
MKVKDTVIKEVANWIYLANERDSEENIVEEMKIIYFLNYVKLEK